MYASQWFLTVFAAKFPLNLAYRIFDIFLTEGLGKLSVESLIVTLLQPENDFLEPEIQPNSPEMTNFPFFRTF